MTTEQNTPWLSDPIINGKQVACHCCNRYRGADHLLHRMVLCEMHLLRSLVLLRMLLLSEVLWKLLRML